MEPIRAYWHEFLRGVGSLGKPEPINSTNSNLHSFASAATAAVIDVDVGDVTENYQAVYVGEDGNLAVTIGGTNVTFSNIIAGTILPIKVSKVFQSGSTAFTNGTVIGLNW